MGCAGAQSGLKPGDCAPAGNSACSGMIAVLGINIAVVEKKATKKLNFLAVPKTDYKSLAESLKQISIATQEITGFFEECRP